MLRCGRNIIIDGSSLGGDAQRRFEAELRKCLPGLVARLARIDTPYNPFFERRLGVP
jgi:hypothetical protein